MQKFLLKMALLAALLILPWTTHAQVWTCTFENDADTADWVLINGSQTNKWFIGSTVSQGTGKSLFISDSPTGAAHSYSGTASYVYACHPVTVSTAGYYEIMYDWLCNGESSYDFLRVALVPASVTLTAGSASSDLTSTSMPSNWISLDGGQKLNLSSNWTNYSTMVNVPAGDYNLVFYWKNDGSVYNVPPAAVDNVSFGQPTCLHPVNLSYVPTDHSVFLSWTEAGTAEEWYITLSDGENISTYSTYEDTLTLFNLDPNTNYSLSLAAVCGPGDTSSFVNAAFHTACLAIPHDSLPYTEGFESASLNPCWASNRMGVSSTYPSMSSSYAHSGNKSLYFYGYSSTYYCYAVLPYFEDSISNLMLSFWVLKTSSSYGALTVGVIEDPDNFSTFHQLAVLDPPESNYEWERRSVAFPNYQGSGYFCIVQNSSYYAYVDDVKVEELPSCAPMASLEVTDVSATAARIVYRHDRTFGDVMGYEITLTDTNENSTVYQDTATHFIFSGLNPSTTYTVSVRALCEDDQYGSEEFVTFTTGDCIASGTYIIGSENSGMTSSYAPTDGCYEYSYAQMIYTTSQMGGPRTISTIGFYLSTSATTIRDWTIYMGETSRSSFSSTDDYVPVSQMTNMGQYDVNCGQDGWVYIELDSTFEYSGTSNFVIAVDDNTGSYYCTPYWAASQAPANQVLYFNQDGTDIFPSAPWAEDGSSFYDSFLPTIAFVAPCDSDFTCAPPMAFVDNSDASSISLYWAPGYQETAWDVDYMAEGDSVWTNAFSGITETFCTIEELLSNVNYTIRVSSLCSDTIVSSMVSARTVCDIQPVPFFENFESWPTSSTSPAPNCWFKKSTYSSGYPYVSTSYAIDGSKAMYFYSGSGAYSMLVFPQMAPSIDSLYISFAIMSTYASYSHTLEVGVITDPNDISTFTSVGTVAPSTTLYEWNYNEVSFANYTGPNGRIAIKTQQGQTCYPYVDDIVVDYIRTCARPDSIDVVATPTSATLSWSSTAQEFEVAYGSYGSSITDGTMTFDVTSDLNYTINGLESGQRYVFYVRAICGSEDTSSWSFAYNFTSGCGNITHLPYRETFSSWGANSSVHAPACWTPISTYSSTYPYLSVSYDHTGDGVASMYLYYYNGGSGETGIILPPIDQDSLPINTIQLEFWAKASSYFGNSLIVGVTDSMGNNFTPVDTVTILTSAYTLFEVPMNNYTGTGNRIALKCLINSGSYQDAYIDDLELVPIPTCLRPTDITCVSVSASSADLAWQGNAPSYEVFYGEYGASIDSMTVINTNTNSVQITGLTNDTRYSVYVLGLCSSDDSSRMGSSDFRTLRCLPETNIPYSCSFADTAIANAWTLLNPETPMGNKWYIGSTAYNGTTDTMGLFISYDSAASNNYSGSFSAVYAYRDFILDADDYAISFDWNANGESSYDYIRAFLAPASANITPGTLPDGGSSSYSFANTTPTGWIALDGSAPLNLASSWNTQINAITIDEPGTYRLLFMWANDGSVYNDPAGAIDNVNLVRNTCPWVTNLHVTNYSADSAFLAWNAGGSETSWSVMVGNDYYYTTTPSIAIGGLTPSTPYTFSVKALCSASDSSLAASVSVTTRCLNVSIPYFENFDSITTSTAAATGEQPACWEFTLTNSSYSSSSYQPQVYYSPTYAHSGNYSLRLYGVGYHVLPPVDVPLDSLQVSFYYTNNATYYGCEVGVMEGQTFIPIETVPNVSGAPVFYSVYLNGYEGPSRTIAFRNYYINSTTGYGYVYLDDITIDYLPTCPRVANVSNPAATMTSVDIDWTGSSAPEFELRYGLHGTPFNQCASVFSNVHPATITGLDTLSAYDVYVRPICAAGDTGDWVGPCIAMTTICDDAAMASIGSTASSGTSYYYPVNNFFRYTLSETIIDSAELAATVGTAEIAIISFYYDYSSPTTSKPDVTMYLQPTTKSVFASSSDIDLLDTTIAVKVYDGAFNFSQGWNELPLDTTFTWSGEGNLMLIVDDNSNDYDGSSYVFKSDATAGSKTLYWYSDSYNPDPFSSSYSGTKAVASARVVMKLTACGVASCKAPVLNEVQNIVYDGADISWTSPATNFEVAIKANTDAEWGVEVPVASNSYTFSGLQPLTDYQFRVRALCEDGAVSNWAMGTFTTVELPCLAPAQLAASNVTFSGASFSWTPTTFESNWAVRVWNSTFDTTFNAQGTPAATINGLIPDVEYYAAVQALCGTNGEIASENWSDTISFTTDMCDEVSGVNTSVSGTTATINWTPGANNNGAWEVRYGYEGFTNGEQIADVPATSNTVTLSNLETFRTYDVYVRAKCEEGIYSNWSTKISFYVDQVGIHTADNANVSIYPNPASGSTSISLAGIAGQVEIAIVDMNGRTIRTDNMECDGNCVKTINVDGLAQGAYFVRVTSNNFNAVKKLIVK